MFFLRSVKNFLMAAVLKSIYFAIVHSHFVYGNQIWSCKSPSNLNVLFINHNHPGPCACKYDTNIGALL